MIFNLWEAHQIMRNPHYDFLDKIKKLHELGLSYIGAVNFYKKYTELYDDSQFLNDTDF